MREGGEIEGGGGSMDKDKLRMVRHDKYICKQINGIKSLWHHQQAYYYISMTIFGNPGPTPSQVDKYNVKGHMCVAMDTIH